MNRPTTWISPPWNGWKITSDLAGSVFIVSHDRYFLDQVVNVILEMTPIWKNIMVITLPI